jgi:hypothetical protein
VLLFVIGAGVVVAPLVIGIPGKVDAAVRVTRIGRAGLAPATAQKAVGATNLFDGMVADVHTKLAPALSAQSDNAAFSARYPTLSRFADDWTKGISRQSHDLSNSQVRLGPTFANADRIPLRPIPWLFILPGAAIALLAGGALVASARDARAAQPAGAVATA